MAIKTPFLKPSAASDTGSTPKLFQRYQEDPFFRTTVNIIALQTILVLLIAFVFAFAVQYQQERIVGALYNHVSLLADGATPPTSTLTDAFTTIRIGTLGAVFVVLITLSVLFGIIAARYTLSPTRETHTTQRKFIGNLAHELRTPLAIMRTDTEVALMDPALSNGVRKTFESTMEELDRISGIINNLLTFNSLMRPGQISLSGCNIASILDAVVNRHMELATSRGITLGLVGTSTALVYGNTIALEQVFTNLIKNALNYTPQHDGRSVTVRVEDNDKISVSVIDTGIGIAERDLFHVFEPFYRGDTSRSRGIGSGTSGLGLAIVNDIVRAHQGSITIRSALNRGTTIEITLPKAEDTADLVELPISDEDDGAEHEVAVLPKR